MTSNGITADLEAMQRAGIRGLTVFDVDQGAPKGPVEFGSPTWRNLFMHLCSEAQRLGLEVSMNNDAGWCGSGGPWITPELSMQKVVWSKTSLKGPAHFNAFLPPPEKAMNYYEDITVFAFPTPPADELQMTNFSPKVTASSMDQDFAPEKLLDHNPDTTINLPHPQPDHPHFVQLEFPQPFTARSLKLTMSDVARLRTCLGAVEASDDGTVFHTVASFKVADTSTSIAFDEVTARLFRIRFDSADYKIKQLAIGDIELSPAARIDNIEAKALFVGKKEFSAPSKFSPTAADAVIARKNLVDLTPKLGANGKLEWDVPPGRWTILRFGHTTTGTDNHPAPAAGRGLECDKLSKAGAEASFNGLLAKLTGDNASLLGKTFVSAHIDSWEVGPQNWTPKFREEFQRLRGYDPLPYLPILTGRVIDSQEISERFLWDFRQTISDLLIENYAGHLHDLANQHGINLSIEAYDGDPCEDLAYAGRADIPMGEFWSWVPYGLAFSCTEMASAAHVYGKPIVAAEAFTAAEGEKWQGHPFNIKAYGDWAFCEGINRFVVHRYAFQPWPDIRAPGMAMGPFGLHYERTQTWWEKSKPWHEYLARCQYLLQQGQFVADICYLAPEKAPLRWQPTRPSMERPGYNFDGCPPEVVLNRMSVRDGKLVLPDGMSYRLLVLPDSDTMTPKLLGRIKELVEAGATVVGRPPSRAPGLSNYPECDREVRKLVGELWFENSYKPNAERRVGKGRVVWGESPEQVLTMAGIPPDFEGKPKNSPQRLRYIHKTIGDKDVYFVANKLNQPEDALCTFRVTGKTPEFWHPDTGQIELPAQFSVSNSVIQLPIHFDPCGSVFVVFQPNGARTFVRSDFEETYAPILETTTDLTNTFTIAGWIKPEANIDLPREAAFGSSGLNVKRNDALYPPPGQEAYPEPNQAGAGISVGRNGVCVFEHGCGHFAPVLVCPVPIARWTHVAVVYRDGTPSLYLNGEYIHEGVKSTFAVHPGVGVQHWRNPAPFSGELGELQKFSEALSGPALTKLAQATPIPGSIPDIPSFELFRTPTNTFEATLWKRGTYDAQTAKGQTLHFDASDLPAPLEITGPWQLHFPAGWGAPQEVTLDKLISWSQHPNPGVKYFSGNATYRTKFTLPDAIFGPNRHIFLDLGRVAVMARLQLNGNSSELMWKPPFRTDITSFAHPGENELEIEVVNLWINRMIGDEQLPDDTDRDSKGALVTWPNWLRKNQPSPTGRYAFTTWRLWKKNSPLQESGLLGPVRVIVAKEVTVAAR
jgi:hypothetical protein